MAEEYKLDHNSSHEGVKLQDLDKANSIIYNDATKADRMLTITHIIALNAKTKDGAIALFRTMVRESKLPVNHPQHSARLAVMAATYITWLKKHALNNMPSGTQDLSLLNTSEVKVSIDAVTLLTITEEVMAFFLNIIEDTSYAVSTEANFLHIHPGIRIHTPSKKLVTLQNDMIKQSDPASKLKKVIAMLSKEDFLATDATAVNDLITETVEEFIKFNYIVNDNDYSRIHEIIPAGKSILTLTDKKAMVTSLGQDSSNASHIGFTSTSTVASQEPEYRKNSFYEIRQSLLACEKSSLTDNEKKATIKTLSNDLSRQIFDTPISLFEIKGVLDKNSDLNYDIAGLTSNPRNYIKCDTDEFTAASQRLLVIKDEGSLNGLVGELRANSISQIANNSNFSSENAITFALIFGSRMKTTPMSKQYIKGMTARGVSDDFVNKILNNSIYLDLQGTFHMNDKLMVMFKTSRDMINAARATDVALMKIHSDNFAQRGEFRKWVETTAATMQTNTLKFIDSLSPQKRLADAKFFGSNLLDMMYKDGLDAEKIPPFYPARTMNETKIIKRNTIFMLNNFRANVTNPKQFRSDGGTLEFSVVGNYSDEEIITLEVQREAELEIIRKNPRFDGRKTTWVQKDSVNRPFIPYYENDTMASKKKDFVFKKADISQAFYELMDGNEYKGKFSAGFVNVKVGDMMNGSGSQSVDNVPDIMLLECISHSSTQEISATNTISTSGQIMYFNVFDQFDSKYPALERNGVKISNAKGFFKTLVDNTFKNFLNKQAVTILPLGLHEELKFKFRLKSPMDLLGVSYYQEIDLGFLTNKSIHTIIGLDMMNDHTFLYDFKSLSITQYLYRALMNSAKLVLYNVRNYPTLFRILKDDSIIDNRLAEVVRDGMKAFTTEMQPFSDEQKIVIMSIILPTLTTLVNDFDKTWSEYKNKNTTKVKKVKLREKIIRISPANWNAEAYVTENIPGLESIIGADASSLHLATEANVSDIISGNAVTDVVDIANHEGDVDFSAESSGTTPLIAPKGK